MATVTVNPSSRIMARVLDRDPNVQIDQAWIAARLQRAHTMRERVFDTPYYRLVHAEADGLPGVIIDRFGEIAVVQPNAAWAEALLPQIVDSLVTVTGVTCVIKNASGRARVLEGLDDSSGALLGDMPASPRPVVMNGATYMADLTGGQKTGLFYDQRPNHAFAATLAAESRVLDVFSHVGDSRLRPWRQALQVHWPSTVRNRPWSWRRKGQGAWERPTAFPRGRETPLRL